MDTIDTIRLEEAPVPTPDAPQIIIYEPEAPPSIKDGRDRVLLPVVPPENEDYWSVKYMDLDMTAVKLKELCRLHKITGRTTKAAMHDALIEYSGGGPDVWDSYHRQANRNSHRGPRTGEGSRKSAPKASYRRRQEVLGISHAASTDRPEVVRSADTRTRQQKEALLPMAIEYCKTHPYVPRDRRHSSVKEPLPMARAESWFSMQSDNSLRIDAQRLGNVYDPEVNTFCVDRQRPGSGESIGKLVPLFPFPPCPDPFKAKGAESVERTRAAAATTHVHAYSEPLVSHEAYPVSVISIKNVAHESTLANTYHDGTTSRSHHSRTSSGSSGSTLTPTVARTLCLAGGVQLHIAKEDIPEPKKLSFVEDEYTDLLKIWDDEWLTFDPAHPKLLHLQGQPIAMKYWKDLFSQNGGRWGGIKGKYSDCKYVAEELQKLGEHVFKTKYANANSRDRGRRMERGPVKTVLGVTEINRLLREERKALKAASSRDAA